MLQTGPFHTVEAEATVIFLGAAIGNLSRIFVTPTGFSVTRTVSS